MHYVLRVIMETGKVVMLVLQPEGFKDLATQVQKIEAEGQPAKHDESQGPDLEVLGG